MRSLMCVGLVAALGAGFHVVPTSADDENHVYKAQEPVVVWVQSVYPYHNPSEVYRERDLFPPVSSAAAGLGGCPGDRLSTSPPVRPPHLGELLLGSELENSELDVQFKVPVEKVKVCSFKLDEEAAKDDLPVYAMIGEIVLDETQVEDMESGGSGGAYTPHGIADNVFVYTHRTLSVAYNGDQIVAVNLTASEPVRIESGKSYDMSYSVSWAPSQESFEGRYNRYIDNDMRRHQVRWFGVINSALMAVFLCGTVALILLRTLRADFARYLRDDEEDGSGGGGSVLDKAMGDETGWKQVGGDVFRRPHSVVLYSALVGTGSHLFLLAIIVILASLAGSLHVDRGAVLRAGVLAYAFTSMVSGFFSGAFYRSLFADNSSPQWIRVMLFSSILFPGICVAMAVLLSIPALGYGTSSYISLWTILKIALLWAVISAPLTVLGTIAGRRFGHLPFIGSGSSGPAFRVNQIPRPVPVRPWYLSAAALSIAAGFLPFGSVFVEIYYVATSIWGHAIYAAWALFLMVLLILAMVVSCVSIVSTYLLLNAEDHRWHWHSFASGASVSVYVFAYAIYFYIFRTEMSGLLQASFYFGYTLLGCIALALLTGTVGTVSSMAFVRAIYSSIKAD